MAQPNSTDNSKEAAGQQHINGTHKLELGSSHNWTRVDETRGTSCTMVQRFEDCMWLSRAWQWKAEETACASASCRIWWQHFKWRVAGDFWVEWQGTTLNRTNDGRRWRTSLAYKHCYRTRPTSNSCWSLNTKLFETKKKEEVSALGVHSMMKKPKIQEW